MHMSMVLCQRESQRAASRWLQSAERRIGELGMRPTLMFNGYGDK